MEARFFRWATPRSALAALVLGGPAATDLVSYIRAEADSGSVLAQAALGYCLERGIGMSARRPDAAAMYRKAAQRGSQMAYRALRNMYDALRPGEAEFRIE